VDSHHVLEGIVKRETCQFEVGQIAKAQSKFAEKVGKFLMVDD
jgi:hypothetical protein